MDKLKMHSPNKIDENIRRIGEMFPNCLTERLGEDGKPEACIDFDMLKQELSSVVVEGNEERYQFTWPDKKKSILLANAPISATLRPCREESVDFDNTENLYIEGENLDVLKLLQETYLGKIKMIYIDPPYNTGNDFVYEDDFAESAEEYLANSGQYDDQGNRLVTNLDSNGRFHTDWLNMIYPRLKVAKDLLSDDGVMFISIDEHEEENLKKVCEEIFGSVNFVGNVIWERAFSPKNDAKFFSDSHDYILVFAKNISCFSIGKLPRTEEANSRYKNPDNDPRGPWTSGDCSVKTYSASCDYPITTPSGRIVNPPHGSCWRFSKESFAKLVADNRIWFGESGENVPRVKRFLSEVDNGITPTTIWKYDDVGHNQEGRQELKRLFDDKGYFDGPKPVRLLSRILQIANVGNDDIVLDFFSGSATTAHAIISQNFKDLYDGKHSRRRFIMVQLPEECDKSSEAYKAGYKNICEIGKDRIRRAGKSELYNIRGFAGNTLFGRERKNKEGENYMDPEDVDIGFRVLKLDSSNMKDVYYTPNETTRTLFDSAIENIKEDRTDEDLLFQVMLELGVVLSSKIETTTIAGKQIFDVADGFLIACFEKGLTDEIITEIAKKKPYYFVTRDHSIASDSVATNFDQIFATYSPETVRKVL